MFAAMAFLFVVNIIVVSLVVKEVCGTTTKETPVEVMENSRELEVIELTSEEERATMDGFSTEIAIREPCRQEEEEALTIGQQVERREQSGEQSEPFYALRAATLGRGHEMFHNDMILNFF